MKALSYPGSHRSRILIPKVPQKLSIGDVIPTRLIAWATPRPKSCSRPNTWPTCTFKPKPIKRPNNKEHAQKDPIGLHS